MARFMRDPATKNRAARGAETVAEQGYERSEITPFVGLKDQPRPSDEQGVGKTPGIGTMPWQRVFQSLVPKRQRMGPGWPNRRTTPPRVERTGWGTDYLLFFEQRNRHVWPGGYGAPQVVIEHPQTVPLVSLAPRL